MKIDSNQIQMRKVPNFFNVALGVGIVSMIASLIGLFVGQQDQFFFSALTAGIFTLGISLGGLFFVLIHYLAGARWSTAVRRVSEVMAVVAPYIAVMIGVIVLYGIHHLYVWSNADVLTVDAALQKKHAYLNFNFFTIRLVIYIGIWAFLTKYLLALSVMGDGGSNDDGVVKARQISPVGMILFALTVTFSAFDWMMSLDPHWYSTIFGVYVFAGYVVSFFAASILIFRLLHKFGYLQNIVTVEHFHDLGKLMFAFVCFWAFMAVSQYLLIWYGNLPEETIFYVHRAVGAWYPLSIFLPIGHFAIPFVLLMSRPGKRNLNFLCAMAVWVLLVHFIDLHWLILPNFHRDGFSLSWLDVTTLIGFIGIFLGILGRKLTQQALIPLNDPYLETSLQHISR